MILSRLNWYWTLTSAWPSGLLAITSRLHFQFASDVIISADIFFILFDFCLEANDICFDAWKYLLTFAWYKFDINCQNCQSRPAIISPPQIYGLDFATNVILHFQGSPFWTLTWEENWDSSVAHFPSQSGHQPSRCPAAAFSEINDPNVSSPSLHLELLF